MTTTTPAKGNTDLAICREHIAAANDQFGKSFQQWIVVVGEELRTAQKLLSVDGSHDSQFGRWVKENTGWTLQRAHQIMDAEETIRFLSTTVDMKALPSSERQCRELVCVPGDELPAVWEKVTEHAEETGEPITAKVIQKFTEAYRPEKKCEEESVRGSTGANPGHDKTEQFALESARCAITQLERIPKKNPGREKAFVKVEKWINESRGIMDLAPHVPPAKDDEPFEDESTEEIRLWDGVNKLISRWPTKKTKQVSEILRLMVNRLEGK